MNVKILILAVVLFCTPGIFAQKITVEGTVRDTAGHPLIGVNVTVAETNFGAATGKNGNFKIENLKRGRYTLEFSSIGYKSHTLTNLILDKNPFIINVTMQEEAYESQQVIVTAGKYYQKVSELPVSADVVYADALADKNITNLGDAMRFVPGVNMIDDQISIRGSSGYTRGAGTRVLLEIDGIPYYTGDTGEIIWEIIPVTDIQRVEIIKGAASSLYGSSAIGGVINVITNNIPSKPVSYVKCSFGAYDKPAYPAWEWTKELRSYNGLTFSHSNKIGNLGFTVSLTRLSDLSYEQSGFYKRYIGYLKTIYNFSPTSSLSFFANSLNQNHGNFLYWKDLNHALQPPDADQGQRVISNRYMFGSIYKDVLSKDLFLNLRASYYNSNWRDQTSSFNSSLSNLFRLEVQINATLADKVILVSGLEGTKDKVSSNIFGDQNSYGFGAYSQADINFSFPMKATFGLRYDYSKLSNLIGVSAISPKAGLNYRISSNLTLRSSFGTGFRAPTLSEAFTTTSAGGITIKPNPGLKPERNWTFEVGGYYSLYDNFNLDAALFQNEFYDFIEPGVDPSDGLIYFANITRARIQGFEISSDYSLLHDKLKLKIGYTYLWARDLQKNIPLKYRPRNMIDASLDYFIGNLNLGTDFRYSSKVEEMDYELVNLGLLKDGRSRVEIRVLDLRAAYNLAEVGIPAKIYINANNIFNYNYVELIGNIAPIRNYSISMEFLF